MNGPADLVGVVEHVEDLLLLLGLDEVADEGGAFGDFRRPPLGEAHERMRQAVADPVGRDAAVGAAIAVELAALDREPLLGAAREAQDLLDRGVEHLAQGGAVDVVA